MKSPSKHQFCCVPLVRQPQNQTHIEQSSTLDTRNTYSLAAGSDNDKKRSKQNTKSRYERSCMLQKCHHQFKISHIIKSTLLRRALLPKSSRDMESELYTDASIIITHGLWNASRVKTSFVPLTSMNDEAISKKCIAPFRFY